MFEKLVNSYSFYLAVKEQLRQISCVIDHIHRRTWVTRMEELGHYDAKFFQENIIPILEKKSPLPAWERRAIRVICNQAAKSMRK